MADRLKERYIIRFCSFPSYSNMLSSYGDTPETIRAYILFDKK